MCVGKKKKVWKTWYPLKKCVLETYSQLTGHPTPLDRITGGEPTGRGDSRCLFGRVRASQSQAK